MGRHDGAPILMAVQFVNLTTASSIGDQNISLTHTAEGANRLLLVYIASRSTDVSAVSFDGNNLDLVATATRTLNHAEVWRLINPTAGAATMVVNMAASVANMGLVAITVGSADQSTPIAGAASGNGAATASISAAVSVSSDWMAFSFLRKLQTNPVPSSAQQMTERVYFQQGVSADAIQVAETSASSGIYTVRWVEASAVWTMLVPVVRHFVAGVAGTATVSPPATDIIIAPQAANIAAGKALAPGASDILVAIQAPNIAAGKTIAPGETNIIVAGQEPTISIPVIVAVPETPIIVAPQAPVIAAGKVLEPGATDVVVAPQEASPAAGKTVAPGETNIIVAPQDPLIIAGSPIIQPDAADILINGQAPTIAAGKTVAPGQTDILLEVQNADVVVTAAAAVSSRLFSVYRGKGLRHTEGVRDFEKTTGDQFVSDESE